MYIRSSVATKMGLTLVNSVGIIDSDYVDETHIIVHNVSDTVAHVHDGDRLAQCRLASVTQQDIKEVKKKPGTKTDRKGGIGSTGR
jgi:dUTP pyrophosphatase